VLTDRHSSSAISMMDMLVGMKRKMVGPRWVSGSGMSLRTLGTGIKGTSGMASGSATGHLAATSGCRRSELGHVGAKVSYARSAEPEPCGPNNSRFFGVACISPRPLRPGI
jgi:hypothetical protein